MKETEHNGNFSPSIQGEGPEMGHLPAVADPDPKVLSLMLWPEKRRGYRVLKVTLGWVLMLEWLQPR